MKVRKFAVRGLIVLAVCVALCMFFSGTIATITTAKIKVTQAKWGKLETKTDLSGKLTFADEEKVGFALDDGQTLRIDKVNYRVGFSVNEGEAVIEASVVDYDKTVKQLQTDYSTAMDSLLDLESKNSKVHPRRSDELYADAYFEYRAAQNALLEKEIEMDTLLKREGKALPEVGEPEGASEALTEAIRAYRAAEETVAAAKIKFGDYEHYKPEDATWTYLNEKRNLQQKMDAAEKSMRALSALNNAVQAIIAPHDGYIAKINVKAGDVYDGSEALFTMTPKDTMPVLRAEASELPTPVTTGMTVSVGGNEWGGADAAVTAVGTDDEGKKYIDVAVNDSIISTCGSVYAMMQEAVPMKLVQRAQQSSTLISVNAVHGSGANRSVFVVETQYSSVGNSKMTVRKMDVTVLGESEGIVSVQEDLSYTDLAYMEDRPLNDGDAVMLYIE